MDNMKLEITLKTYLDERFSEINTKLNKLDMLRQDEHDVVVSMARDVSFRSDEIAELKKNAIDCKSECLKRKSDFDQRVIAIVEPRISSKVRESTDRIWRTIIVSAIMALTAVTGYIIDKWVMEPARVHIEKNDKARK